MLRLIAVTLILSGAATPQSKKDVAWVPNSDTARGTARESCKPMLIEAWATWCGPCKTMDREVWPDRRVIEASKKFVAVSFELRYITDPLPVPYKVQVIPTIIVSDPWGEVLTAREGYVDARELSAMLREIPGDYSPVREARELLEKDRGNGRALGKVAEFYQANGALGLANRYYSEALRTNLAKEDDALRENLTWAVAMNEMRMNRWSDARKSLEQFLERFPDSKSHDQALLGLVIVNVRRGKMADARKWLAELKRLFPASDALASAGQVLRR